MFGNIKKNNVRGLGLKLRNDEYYDFMLYKGECYSTYDSSSCIVMGLDAKNIGKDGSWKSSYVWGEATTSDVLLNNIGYTGVDNGLIKFEKDRITNKEFLDVFTGSSFTASGGAITMYPITGNTLRYSYPYEVNDDFVSLKGGFFQGFYKIEGSDYQILPNVIDSDWNFEITLRRKDYEVGDDTLVYKYPNNKGIFFYMGTRAENKFSVYYGVDEKEIIGNSGDDYFAEDGPIYENMCGGEYLCANKSVGIIKDTPFESDYFGEEMEYNSNVCGEDDYFSGDYFDKGCPDNGLALDGDYFETDVDINDDTLNSLKTKEGYSLSQHEREIFTTDNKFLLFNRTKTGYTTDTWDETIEEVKFVDVPKPETENKFLLFNRTKTGYTTDNFNEYEVENKDQYDVLKDLKENAFAVKIDEDGAISYRYAVNDCDSESGYSVLNEKSVPGLVKVGEWVTINIRASILGSDGVECGVKVGDRKMKLYFYVNGNLVLVSKELPEFRFRGLDEIPEKQEAVPYNISVGGGTQGLVDGIWLKDIIVSDDYFPLMKDFGGSFIGDIKSFRFYNCFRNYPDIRNSVLA